MKGRRFVICYLIDSVDSDHLPEFYENEIVSVGRLLSLIFESDIGISVKEAKFDNSRVCNRDCKKSR